MTTVSAPVDIKLAEDLKFDLECPICNVIPRSGPIYQCENGHMICKDCRTIVDVCPNCESNFGQTRSLIAEKMLQKLPKTCQYAENGCKEEHFEDSITKHELSCGFRRVQCVHPSCKEKITFSKLFDHLKEFHPGPVPMCNLSNKTMTISLGKNQFQTTTHHAPHHMKYKGNDFFVEICRCNDKALWHFWVFFVGNRADATQYLYRIKLSNPHLTESVVYEGNCVSIDVPKTEIKTSGLAFQLSDAAIIRMVVNESVGCNISIFTEEDKNLKPKLTRFEKIRKLFSRK